MDELPSTPEGEVEREAMAHPIRPRPETTRPYAAPATGAEEWVARVWEEVLRVDRVGRDDDFFQLGGGDAEIVRVAERLRERLGIDLAGESLREVPTVAALAESLEVIELRPEHGEGVLALYRRHFGEWSAARFAARLRWQYGVGNPFVRERLPFGKLVVRDGEVVGHMAGFPLPWRIEGERRVVLCGADMAVDEGFRLFTMQIVGTFAKRKPSFCNGIHPSLRKLFTHFGAKEVRASGERYVLRLRGGARLAIAARRRLPAALANLVTPRGVGAALDSAPARGLFALAGRRLPSRTRLRAESITADIRPIERFDASHDELWSRVRPRFRATLDKDSTYMNWRYVDCPTLRAPIRLGLHREGRLVAVAVAGVHVLLDDRDSPCGADGEVLELIADEPAGAESAALLSRACRELERAGVDAIGATGCDPAMRQALERLGFERERHERFDCLVLFDPADEARAGVDSPEGWYLTAGDGDGLYAFLT